MTIANKSSFQSAIYRFIDKLWHLAACKDAKSLTQSRDGELVAYLSDYYDDVNVCQETKLTLTGLYRVCPVNWVGFLTMLAMRAEMIPDGKRTITH